MRSREPKPRTPVMDARQSECFRLFVELGDGRSIPALYRHTTALGMEVSLRQLLRWSAQYRWTEHAKKTTAVIAAKVEELMLEDSVAWARKQSQRYVRFKRNSSRASTASIPTFATFRKRRRWNVL